MSVSPDPAALRVGGCHVFLALSPDPGTVQDYLRLGLPGIKEAREIGTAAVGEIAGREGLQEGLSRQAAHPSFCV